MQINSTIFRIHPWKLSSNSIAMFLIGVAFFCTSFYTVSVPFLPLKVADLAGIFLCIALLFNVKKIRFSTTFLLLSLWLLWGIISFIIAKFFSHYPFVDLISFVQSFMRLPISLAMLLVVPSIFSGEKSKVVRILKTILILHCIAQLIIVALVYLGNTSFFNIVLPGQVGRGEILNVFSFGNKVYRFGGLFEEPSWFGWFIMFSFAILLAYEVKVQRKIVSTGLHILVLTALFFTFSVSAFAFYGVIIFIRFVVLGTFKQKIALLGGGGLLLMGVLFFASTVYSDNYVVKRFQRVIEGEDNSSNSRLEGSLSKAKQVLMAYPITGSTIGNADNLILYLNKRSHEEFYIQSTISNQIGILEPFIATGIIGGILFLIPLLLIAAQKKYFLLIIAFLLTLLTTSAIFVVPLWLLFSIGLFVLTDEQKETFHTNING